MPNKNDAKKHAAMKAAAQTYPKLHKTLNRMESVAHMLELTDGRYGYIKYLQPLYEFYLKSKERQTRKRDRIRICRLRGLTYKKNADLFGVLLQATSGVPRSTRSKYAAKLRTAAKQGVASEGLMTFIKKPMKRKVHKRALPSIIPNLRLAHSPPPQR